MFTSPVIGFAGAFAADARRSTGSSGDAKRKPMARPFRELQVISAGYMAFAHGSNDAQKTMGIITLALFSAGRHPDDRRADLGHRRVGDGAVAGDRGRRLADHADDGPAGRQARAGPRLRRRDDRGDRPPRDRPFRACRSRRRRSSPARSWASARASGAEGRPLGRRPAHPRRLGPHRSRPPALASPRGCTLGHPAAIDRLRHHAHTTGGTR